MRKSPLRVADAAALRGVPDTRPHAGREDATERMSSWLGCGYMVLLFVFGGASRPDTFSQIFVRLAAIAVIATMLWRSASDSQRRQGPVLIFAAAATTLMVLQLIPLPPNWWAHLPGRQIYVDPLQQIGLADRWRPISLKPDMTLNSLLSLLPPLAAVLVFGSVGVDGQRRVLATLLLLILGSGLIAGVQLGFGGPYLYAITNQGAGVGVFANRNHQGMLLALTFALIAVWVRLGRHQVASMRFCLLLGFVGAALVPPFLLITGSRGGLIAGGLGALLTAIFLLPRVELRTWRDRGLTALPVVLALVVAALAVTSTQNVALDRLLHNDQTDVRWQGFPVVVSLIRSYLPVGSGFGTFDAAYRQVEPNNQLSPTYFNHAHNDLLELGLEGGLLAWLLLALMLAWLVRCSWIVLRAPARDGFALLGRAGLIGMALLLFGSVLDYPLRTPLLASLFVLFAGWTSRAAGRRGGAALGMSDGLR